MGQNNIERLKVKTGFKKENAEVDDYFELIDRIYYQNQGYSENFNYDTEVTTWFFEDEKRISFDIEEVTHLALFLLSLSNDIDEQLVSVADLEKSYFLKENKWQMSK